MSRYVGEIGQLHLLSSATQSVIGVEVVELLGGGVEGAVEGAEDAVEGGVEGTVEGAVGGKIEVVEMLGLTWLQNLAPSSTNSYSCFGYASASMSWLRRVMSLVLLTLLDLALTSFSELGRLNPFLRSI